MGQLQHQFFAVILGLVTLATGAVATALFVHYEYSARRVEHLVTNAHQVWLREQLELRAEALAEAAADLLVNPLERMARSEIDVLARALAAEPQVAAVSVFDHEGILLTRRTGAPSPADSRPPDPLRIEAPVGGAEQRLGRVRISFSAAEPQHIATLATSMAEINQEAHRSRVVWLLALAVLVFVLAVLAAKAFARVFSRPIERLVTLTEQIRHGERPLEFPTDRVDEIGDLARALARLVQDLERTTVSRDKFDQILANMGDGLVVTNAEGRITDANQALLRLLGLGFDELTGQPIRRFLSDHPGNPARSLDSFETRLRGRAPGLVPVLLSSSPIAGSGGRLQGAVYVVHDITERKRAEERIQQLAHHDVLTGLPNRALLADRLRQMTALARREALRAAFLLLDLDDFKKVNDTFGHKAGDELLKQIARRLAATIRESDTAARFGGDEFVVLQMARHPPHDVDALCRRLLEAFGAPFDVQGVPVPLSLSIGVALYPRHGDDLDELLRAADRALYEAKSAGRSTWRFAARCHAGAIAASR